MNWSRRVFFPFCLLFFPLASGCLDPCGDKRWTSGLEWIQTGLYDAMPREQVEAPGYQVDIRSNRIVASYSDRDEDRRLSVNSSDEVSFLIMHEDEFSRQASWEKLNQTFTDLSLGSPQIQNATWGPIHEACSA